MGAAIVLSLFALLIWRCLRILTMAKNLYGTLIAGGITAMLMHQIFVNVGMTIGIMPITGVTLPLMSYGGSSVIVTFLALGLLQSIHAQARETAFAKGRDLASNEQVLMRGIFEKASTRHGRPWRNPSRHPRSGGHAPR